MKKLGSSNSNWIWKSVCSYSEKKCYICEYKCVKNYTVNQNTCDTVCRLVQVNSLTYHITISIKTRSCPVYSNVGNFGIYSYQHSHFKKQKLAFKVTKIRWSWIRAHITRFFRPAQREIFLVVCTTFPKFFFFTKLFY